MNKKCYKLTAYMQIEDTHDTALINLMCTMYVHVPCVPETIQK